MRELMGMMANKGDNIIAHLVKVKQIWDCLIMVCPKKSILSPPTFKKYLASSLPYTWNKFTHQFTHDPTKIDCTIPQFIGNCHKEYCHHLKHGNTLKAGDATYIATQLSLAKCISNDAQKSKPKTPKSKCMHCG